MADTRSIRPLSHSDLADQIWSRSRLRRLESLGYEVVSLRRAFDVLLARARKGSLAPGVNEGVLACANGLASQAEPRSSGALTGAFLHLRVAIAPNDGAGSLALVRQQWTDAACDPALDDWLSASLPDYVASTLLRWPSLRRFWIQELRLEHYQHLFAQGPRLWWVDTEPLPPGGAIPDLDLPGWDHLPKLIARQPERRFSLLRLPLGPSSDWSRFPIQAASASEWPSIWREAHAAVASADGLCLIQEEAAAKPIFEAAYEVREGRIRMTGDPRPF